MAGESELRSSTNGNGKVKGDMITDSRPSVDK
jgi:hypothetical protein